MKYIIALLTITLSISVLLGVVSKDDAINLVLDTIVKDDIGSVDIYVKGNTICSPDTLFVFHGGHIQLPYSENWLFFVDDYPDALW